MPRGISTVPLPTYGEEGLVDIKRQYPMYVMPIDDVLKLERIPTHEEVFDKLVVWEKGMEEAMFVSHTWLSFKHPDDPDNVKLRALQELLKRLVAGKLNVPPNIFAATLAKVKAIPAKKMAKVKYVWSTSSAYRRQTPRNRCSPSAPSSPTSKTALTFWCRRPLVAPNGDSRDDLPGTLEAEF